MNISIGIDIEEIKRFENKSIENDSNFLKKIFTDKELDYCYKSKNYASHLCARYCAKEAAVKALSDLKINDVYYSDIEILNLGNGMPYIKIEKYPDLEIKISMSHCKSYATASVLISR